MLLDLKDDSDEKTTSGKDKDVSAPIGVFIIAGTIGLCITAVCCGAVVYSVKVTIKKRKEEDVEDEEDEINDPMMAESNKRRKEFIERKKTV